MCFIISMICNDALFQETRTGNVVPASWSCPVIRRRQYLIPFLQYGSVGFSQIAHAQMHSLSSSPATNSTVTDEIYHLVDRIRPKSTTWMVPILIHLRSFQQSGTEVSQFCLMLFGLHRGESISQPRNFVGKIQTRQHQDGSRTIAPFQIPYRGPDEAGITKLPYRRHLPARQRQELSTFCLAHSSQQSNSKTAITVQPH